MKFTIFSDGLQNGWHKQTREANPVIEKLCIGQYAICNKCMYQKLEENVWKNTNEQTKCMKVKQDLHSGAVTQIHFSKKCL